MADKKFRQISKLRKGALIVVENITDQDIQQLAEITDLKVTDLLDVRDEQELPRVEKIGTANVIFVRVPLTTASLATQTVAIVYDASYLMVLTAGKNAFIETLLETPRGMATTQKSKVLLKLLLMIATEFTVKTKHLRSQVQAKRKQIEKASPALIRQLIEVEEILNQYLAALIPMKNVFNALLSGKVIKLYEEDNDLVEDMVISINQSLDVCSVNLKSIRSIRDSYQIIFSNKLNQTIKFLTSFTIILTIPTIVSSIYGMNVDLPFQQHPVAFWMVLGFSFLVSGSLAAFFYFQDWF